MNKPTTHFIRLRGPWQLSLPSGDSSSVNSIGPFRVNLNRPIERPWPFDFENSFTGAVELERVFQRPTGLTSQHSLMLSMELLPWPTAVSISLNRELLWNESPKSLLSLSLLLPTLPQRNHLNIVFPVPQGELTNLNLPPFKSCRLGILEPLGQQS